MKCLKSTKDKFNMLSVKLVLTKPRPKRGMLIMVKGNRYCSMGKVLDELIKYIKHLHFVHPVSRSRMMQLTVENFMFFWSQSGLPCFSFFNGKTEVVFLLYSLSLFFFYIKVLCKRSKNNIKNIYLGQTLLVNSASGKLIHQHNNSCNFLLGYLAKRPNENNYRQIICIF